MVPDVHMHADVDTKVEARSSVGDDVPEEDVKPLVFEAHPSPWPTYTDLVYKSPGQPLGITSQQPIIRKICTEAVGQYMPHHLFFRGSYPAGQARSQMLKSVIVAAAESKKQETVVLRINTDDVFASDLSIIVRILTYSNNSENIQLKFVLGCF